MELLAKLEALANKEIASSSQRFFKTRPRQYGEGDLFMGIRVPVLHALSKQGTALSLGEIQLLLDSKWHEARSLELPECKILTIDLAIPLESSKMRWQWVK